MRFEVTKQFMYDRQRENRIINRERMWKLKQQPCGDCGLRWHPYCMTFDHVDRQSMRTTKSGRPVTLNSVTYWNPEVFNMQLELLDVVCRNCHMIREAKRDIDDPKVRPSMKHLFSIWFSQCKGALFIDQSID